MTKNIFLLIVFLLLAFSPKAQQWIPLDEEKYLQQITQQIHSGKTDTVRLRHYLLLSEYWAQSDSLKSREALQQVIQSPAKHTLPEGMLAYYQGLYHAYAGQKAKAKEFYRHAIEAMENDPQHADLLIRAWYDYAYLQIDEKGYDVLVKTLTDQCIPASKKSHNSTLLAYCYTQLGITFMSVGQFDKAEEYHQKALVELEKIPVQTVHLLTYFNLISNYCYKPDSQSAKIYLDKALAIIQPYPDSRQYPNYYYQEAMYYTTKQEYDQALLSLESGVKMAQEKKQVRLLHLLYFRKYNVYLMQQDYQKAKSQLEHILQEKVLGSETVNRRITYTQLANVNELLGDYKQAYHWMKMSSNLGDSIQQEKLLEKMNEYEIAYQTTEKQQKIDRLEQEKKEDELLAKNKNLRITILAIALGLSVVIAFLIYINYRKQQKLNRQISLSHQQDLLHIENQRKYEATRAVLQGEEQERQRIAQDLHDSMGGMLANIRMSISSGDSQNSTDILRKIDKSIAEMRRVSRNLMPETLKNLGLETALRELCESMGQKNFSIQFESFNLSEYIPFQTQLMLYRITQEAISNVTRYAQAANVIVQISQNENLLSLTIEDDGIGFDPSTITYGLGLRNIENRVRLIGGTVDIVSARGQGTTINVECHV